MGPSGSEDLSNDTFISSVSWKMAEKSLTEPQSSKQSINQARFVTDNSASCALLRKALRAALMRQMHHHEPIIHLTVIG